MQLYLLSPLLIFMLGNKCKQIQWIGVVTNLATIIFSWIVTAYLIGNNGLTPTILVNVYDLNYINMVYKASFCRIGPYCVGILLAFVLYRNRTKIEMNQDRNRRLVGIILVFSSMFLLMFITLLTYPWLHGADYRNVGSIIYGSIHRTIWALAWAIIIYGCSTKQTININHLLSLPFFRFLSKLTYQSYLLHSVIISTIVYSARQKMYYTHFNFVNIFNFIYLNFNITHVFSFIDSCYRPVFGSYNCCIDDYFHFV